MNSETSDNLGSKIITGTSGTTGSSLGSTSGVGSMGSGSSTSGNSGSSAAAQPVQRVAQKAHETVDKLEQTLSSHAEKVMDWHEQYGEAAREQIRANPLAVVAGAFAVGYLFAKITR